ncbi:branched-chain amino acid ABC transporter permease [Thalassobaculum salexigens]|mgnify:CR=1 FL=1|uniref:branched-chain amino acid ABC transporter permease n=1 Tax=Thalassobaculum salexigens TaxID=455360 RepID=UPI00248E7CF7|nr:branched-chain amino acid ABC transporter permease [Thalassobaculum salexigens]
MSATETGSAATAKSGDRTGAEPAWKRVADDQMRRGAFRRTLPVWGAAFVVLMIMPLLFSSAVGVTIMNQMGISIVFALSYNMLLGQGGMLSFGHAVYFGLGGFLSVHVMNYVEYDGWWLPLPLLPFVGGLFGLAFAIPIGSFSTRRAGTVFAMISLGVGELVAACSIIFVAFFGGEEGVSGDRTMGPPVFGSEFLSEVEVYYLIAGIVLVAALFMYLFSRTPAGRMANAVRDNEERAEFVGYSQRYVRFVSFCASGFFAGMAGGLFAINYEILTEENLNLVTSGWVLLMAFIGGVGFFVGPIVGAIVLTLLQTVLSNHTELWQLYVGILFVLTVMYAPRGLTGLVAMHGPALRTGRLGILARAYGAAVVPLLAFLAGVVLLLEMGNVANQSVVGESEAHVFGLTLDVSTVAPWLVALALAAGGGYALVRLAPRLRDAFARATGQAGAAS